MPDQSVQCVALRALLGQQKVLLPDNTAYTTSLSSYFSQQEAAVQPACIVLPQTSLDVSEAVISLQKPENGQRCPFAIRSGGHTAWAGAANIADGVVIDLRNLNTIELSPDQSTVSVGVGASWDMVYALLDPLGLSVNGGRAAGVGVGGLCLGGGISYFSPRYGWTCDTVTNYQIVLADGSLVNANAQSNPDLFRALKGGNNNFGIVTQIELITFAQGDIWAATMYNDLSIVDDIIAEFVKINSPTAYDEYASLITSFGYSQARNMMVISSNLEYTKPVENPPVFEDYLALPTLQPNGARSLSLVTTLLSTAPVIKAAYEAWKSSVPSIKNIPNIVFALALEPLPPIFYSRHASSNSMGLDDRADSLIVALISATWITPDDDALVGTTAHSLLNSINAAARQLGGLDPYVYLNYAGQNQDPIESYGHKSVRQLQKVRERVDPTLVFTQQVPGGYKIPSS
ncbi:oxidoreductase, FAD-binding, putative [Talaromyces stipitatus ATCC 10500]|uniref:Oxidoreductase, FAD-binding, putative n=1 Tax=Talaromyces stipitatus (strain ATCC 10500 / CBS 375.48 / QM 6759 / NRRL 1006) TaxID=441959 RepID=B8LYV2_TALSN|nr:oxidoreductase, FAD-binding, putative [Talaromyces stipitatus ATCC 10500]EED23461.1 oxidoreductase, FAD-binding, putative [Talaromyces stipitatus ATCC 10500]